MTGLAGDDPRRPRPARSMPAQVHAAEQSIDFVDLGDGGEWDPFIDRLWLEGPARTRPSFPMSFDELAATHGAAAPGAALIFHTGRCGSTLLMSMLRHAGAFVVGEPAVLRGPQVNVAAGLISAPQFERLWVGLVGAFANLGAPQPTIIKLSSWQAAEAPFLLGLLPAAPAVFVHRDPFEVVRSNIASPPSYIRGFLSSVHDADARSASRLPGLRDIPPLTTAADIYATEWATNVEGALAAGDRLRLVAYRDLMERPAAVVADVAAWFGLTVDIDAAMQETGRYAKARERTATYEPETTHRRPELSARARARVASIVAEPLERLRRAEAATSATATSGSSP